MPLNDRAEARDNMERALLWAPICLVHSTSKNAVDDIVAVAMPGMQRCADPLVPYPAVNSRVTFSSSILGYRSVDNSCYCGWPCWCVCALVSAISSTSLKCPWLGDIFIMWPPKTLHINTLGTSNTIETMIVTASDSIFSILNRIWSISQHVIYTWWWLLSC